MPGVTRCRHAETGGEAELPTDALKAWQAHGWEPITGVSRSIEDADAERVDAANAAAVRVDAIVETLSTDKHLTVDQVLEQVGTDTAAATAALQIEQANESPRTTLVARLNQIINPAGDAGNTKEN